MTKEDWEKVKESWTSFFTVIHLKVDGYELSVQPVQSGMKIYRQVYINGWMKGEWLFKDCEERRRFFQCRERFCLPKKFRDDAKKIYGKRGYEQKKASLEEKYKVYYPYWSSFAGFKSHLISANKDIQLINT